MELQRIETVHNTPEQVADYLATTARICHDFDGEIATDPTVFVAVLNLVAAKSINLVQQQPTPLAMPHMTIPRGRM